MVFLAQPTARGYIRAVSSAENFIKRTVEKKAVQTVATAAHLWSTIQTHVPPGTELSEAAPG